jgi:hypothetical protein
LALQADLYKQSQPLSNRLVTCVPHTNQSEQCSHGISVVMSFAFHRWCRRSAHMTKHTTEHIVEHMTKHIVEHMTEHHSKIVTNRRNVVGFAEFLRLVGSVGLIDFVCFQHPIR